MKKTTRSVRSAPLTAAIAVASAAARQAKEQFLKSRDATRALKTLLKTARKETRALKKKARKTKAKLEALAKQLRKAPKKTRKKPASKRNAPSKRIAALTTPPRKHLAPAKVLPETFAPAAASQLAEV